MPRHFVPLSPRIHSEALPANHPELTSVTPRYSQRYIHTALSSAVVVYSPRQQAGSNRARVSKLENQPKGPSLHAGVQKSTRLHHPARILRIVNKGRGVVL